MKFNLLAIFLHLAIAKSCRVIWCWILSWFLFLRDTWLHTLLVHSQLQQWGGRCLMCWVWWWDFLLVAWEEHSLALRWCQANLLIYNTIESQIFVTTLPWSSFQIEQFAYLFDARILTFQKKFIIRVVVGSLGLKPWTLNPKKPSMRTLGLSTLCLFLVILCRMTTAWQNMFQLCKWSTLLYFTQNHILHTEMEKQLCPFLKPKLSSKEKLGDLIYGFAQQKWSFCLKGRRPIPSSTKGNWLLQMGN